MEKKLLKMLDGNDILSIRNEFLNMNIVDIAQAFEEIDQYQLIKLFRILPKDMAAGVFYYVSAEQQQYIIESLTDIQIEDTQENTEDIKKMTVIQPSEEEYLKTSVFILAKHRIAWLLILMISATFTGNIIKRFEDVLQSVVILAAFIPMLMDTGGNAGSQSATLVTRGLALGEINVKDSLKVLWKEFRVSSLVGLVLALVNFFRVYYFEKIDIFISLTVCITLFFTVILAKVVGGLLPIAAKKMKLDPAIMASPLITTIVDAFTLIIYFYMASWLM